MHTQRTRFEDEIVAEFIPPFLGNEKKDSQRAIIFLDGVPAVPHKKRIMSYWSKRGYWVFHPRFRGCWESSGTFLENEPTKDVIDVLSGLGGPIESLWDGRVYHLDVKDICIIGGSFSGPAALFASQDDRVKKVVVLSPVVDWTSLDGDEPMDTFSELVQRCFGQAYRCPTENWKKLQSGDFYNPIRHITMFNGTKIMIVHAQDDTTVSCSPVKNFAQQIGATFHIQKRGGHLSTTLTTQWMWSRRIETFFSVE